MLTETHLIDTWQRTRHSITWVVQQRIGNRETATEITSEAFYRAWKNREKWQPRYDGATVDSWLFRLATNIAIDYLRSFRYRTEKLCPILFEEMHPTFDPVEAAVDRIHFESLSFDRLIDSCTPEQRLVLDLRYRHELTYAEIGRRIGRSKGACKSLLSRGLQKIREEII